MAKRESPDAEDIERINETLEQREGFKIKDRDSYDLAFDDYLSDTAFKESVRDDAFDEYVESHHDVSKERLFTKAKGRDLRRDRLKTAKKVVTTRKAYIKGGARHLDLRGFDTKRQRITKEQVIRRTFTIPARSRGRVVFAMRTSVVVRGRSVARHRDSKGRFVSIKLKLLFHLRRCRRIRIWMISSERKKKMMKDWMILRKSEIT